MMTSEKDTEQNEELNEKQKPPVSMAGRVAATGFAEAYFGVSLLISHICFIFPKSARI